MGVTATHLLGVSMPRSGHHLLEMILKNSFKEDFGYCEFYEAGCCKCIPCNSAERRRARLFFQKSHDFDFADPVSVPGTHRIVQYRSPVPRALSNYELHLRNGASDSVETFREFLIDEAWYFISFYKKWIEQRSKEAIFVSYEELTGDPYQTVFDLLKCVNVGIEPDRLSEGILRAIGERGRDKEKFVPSDVRSHRYSEYPVLANFEDIVIRNCPGYFPIRYFSANDSEKSLIGIVFNAMREMDLGRYDNAVSLAAAAYAHEPDNPRLAKFRRLAASKAESTGPISGDEATPDGAGDGITGLAEPRCSNVVEASKEEEVLEARRRPSLNFFRRAWNSSRGK